MKIKPHIPNSLKSTIPLEISSTIELLDVPFVKQFSQLPNFHQYSVSTKHPGHNLLLAELNNGSSIVIGYLEIYPNEFVNLPIYFRKQ